MEDGGKSSLHRLSLAGQGVHVTSDWDLICLIVSTLPGVGKNAFSYTTCFSLGTDQEILLLPTPRTKCA
jgi:hypothetical protein